MEPEPVDDPWVCFVLNEGFDVLNLAFDVGSVCFDRAVEVADVLPFGVDADGGLEFSSTKVVDTDWPIAPRGLLIVQQGVQLATDKHTLLRTIDLVTGLDYVFVQLLALPILGDRPRPEIRKLQPFLAN